VRGAGFSTLLQKDTRSSELAAIKKLEQKDIEVTLSQDPKGLVDVWDEDGVRIKPGGITTVGRQAIAVENEKFHAEFPDFKVLKYAPVLVEVQIADGRAVEIGNANASYKMSAKDEPINVSQKGVVRALKWQSDGSRRFAVVGLK